MRTLLKKYDTWSDFEILYIHHIISDFVNEKRIKRSEFYEELKKGYPEEYLRLYYSENSNFNFREIFDKYIGDVGKFLGDTEMDKVPFTIEKEKEVRGKYPEIFKYINGHPTENADEILRQSMNAANNFIRQNPIPKFRKIRIRENMIETYLLACAQRRQIDFELGMADLFGKKKFTGSQISNSIHSYIINQ